MQLCINCGKETKHPKFCCSRCSATYNNQQRKLKGCLNHSEKTKRKISESVSKTFKDRGITKIRYCKICGSEKGKCLYPEICKEYLVRKKSINLSKIGFDFSKFGTSEVYKEFEKVKDLICDLYLVKQLSLRAICDLHNMTCESSLVAIMNMYHIERRNQHDAMIQAILSGRSDVSNFKDSSHYHQGWHTTWDNQKVYYRSSYELDLCNELDSKRIPYKMEFLRIPYYDSQLKLMRVSIPDFYLPLQNLIIEIKGDRTYEKVNMIDRFKSYKEKGYNYKLILEHEDFGKRLPATRIAYYS